MSQENTTQQAYTTQQTNPVQQEFTTHLTAAAVGGLWAQYMNATLSDCMFQYFLAKDEDQEIRQVISFVQQVTRSQIQRVGQIFRSDDYPRPIGFTDSDVNVDAPRLYSDPYLLAYVRNLARLALNTYSLSLTIAAREDERQHFQQSITEMVEVEDQAVKAEQSKGLYTGALHLGPGKTGVRTK